MPPASQVFEGPWPHRFRNRPISLVIECLNYLGSFCIRRIDIGVCLNPTRSVSLSTGMAVIVSWGPFINNVVGWFRNMIRLTVDKISVILWRDHRASDNCVFVVVHIWFFFFLHREEQINVITIHVNGEWWFEIRYAGTNALWFSYSSLQALMNEYNLIPVSFCSWKWALNYISMCTKYFGLGVENRQRTDHIQRPCHNWQQCCLIQHICVRPNAEYTFCVY